MYECVYRYLHLLWGSLQSCQLVEVNLNVVKHWRKYLQHQPAYKSSQKQRYKRKRKVKISRLFLKKNPKTAEMYATFRHIWLQYLVHIDAHLILAWTIKVCCMHGLWTGLCLKKGQSWWLNNGFQPMDKDISICFIVIEYNPILNDEIMRIVNEKCQQEQDGEKLMKRGIKRCTSSHLVLSVTSLISLL